MDKTLWTLNVGNYAPGLCCLTYPLLLGYARKIRAQFRIINERRFPDFPVVYEKLQIYELGHAVADDNDWNLYVDSDAIIFPDMFDITERVHKDTVVHYATDHAGNRWRYDNYFRRDGRDIGSCNWFTVASDWCRDLWHPLDDLSLEEATWRIHPIATERQAGIAPEHLIDDYVLSRNIARFGLKVKTVEQVQRETGDPGKYFWHTHRLPLQKKFDQVYTCIDQLGLDDLHEFQETKGWDLNHWIKDFGVLPYPHVHSAAR